MLIVHHVGKGCNLKGCLTPVDKDDARYAALHCDITGIAIYSTCLELYDRMVAKPKGKRPTMV